MDKAALGQDLPRTKRRSSVDIIQLMAIFIFMYTLLLPKGQMGEVWELSKNQFSFGNLGALSIYKHVQFSKC